MWRQESRLESWRCLKQDARSQGVKRLFCVPEWCICCPDDSRYRARFEPCGVKRAVLHALISASNAAHAKSISPHRKTRARRLDRRLLTAWGSGRSRERVSHHGIVLSLVRRAGASHIQGPNILSSELGPDTLQLKARRATRSSFANIQPNSERLLTRCTSMNVCRPKARPSAPAAATRCPRVAAKRTWKRCR